MWNKFGKHWFIHYSRLNITVLTVFRVFKWSVFSGKHVGCGVRGHRLPG